MTQASAVKLELQAFVECLSGCSVVMQSDECTRNCVAAVLGWEVWWGEVPERVRPAPERGLGKETDKPRSGHCFSCWIKLYLKPHLVFHLEEPVSSCCLIQRDSRFLSLTMYSLADGIINDTIPQRLWENILFMWIYLENDLVEEMGCFLT